MPVPLERSQGPLLIGALAGAFFAGLLANQTWLYYARHGKTDRWPFQVCVAILNILTIISYCATARNVWLDFILLSTNSPDVSRPLRVFTPVFSSFVADIFFASRCVMLSKRKWLIGVPLGILIVGELAVGMVAFAFADAFQGLNGGAIPAKVSIWKAAALCVASGANIAISCILTVIIWPKTAGFNERTDTLIQRLLMLSVTTSGINTIWYIATAVSLLVQLHDPSLGSLSNFFNSCITAVTALMVVGTLNLRSTLREHGGQTWTGGMMGSGSVPAAPRQRRPANSVSAGSGEKKGVPFKLDLNSLGSGNRTRSDGGKTPTSSGGTHAIVLTDHPWSPSNDLENQLSPGSIGSGPKYHR